MIRAVAVRVSESHLTTDEAALERPLSCVQALMRLQLAGLRKPSRAAREITSVWFFA